MIIPAFQDSEAAGIVPNRRFPNHSAYFPVIVRTEQSPPILQMVIESCGNTDDIDPAFLQNSLNLFDIRFSLVRLWIMECNIILSGQYIHISVSVVQVDIQNMSGTYFFLMLPGQWTYC